MSKKIETVRAQKLPKTIKVSTIITGFVILVALTASYIFGSQTALQSSMHYNQDVMAQAQNIVKQLK